MRSRNIKPGFFKNDVLAGCSFESRLLFIGLWCMADKEGRIEKRPLRIKAEIFPYDDINIHRELTVLERNAFIATYKVDDKEYLQVINFVVHQSPHHTEAKSKLPSISAGCIVPVNSPLTTGEYPPDSLIPDSLIPDSLIPDSLIPDSKPIAPSRNDSPPKVAFDYETGKFTNISEIMVDLWQTGFPAIDAQQELNKAAAWCMSNPKNKKSNWLKFLTNWFSRAQDKAPAHKGQKGGFTDADEREFLARN
jgi:hypothetical protein